MLSQFWWKFHFFRGSFNRSSLQASAIDPADQYIAHRSLDSQEHPDERFDRLSLYDQDERTDLHIDQTYSKINSPINTTKAVSESDAIKSAKLGNGHIPNQPFDDVSEGDVTVKLEEDAKESSTDAKRDDDRGSEWPNKAKENTAKDLEDLKTDNLEEVLKRGEESKKDLETVEVAGKVAGKVADEMVVEVSS